MSKSVRLATCVVFLVWPSCQAWAEVARPHDITSYGRLDGARDAERVEVRGDCRTANRQVGSSCSTSTCRRKATRGAKLPVILFLNGVGDGPLGNVQGVEDLQELDAGRGGARLRGSDGGDRPRRRRRGASASSSSFPAGTPSSASTRADRHVRGLGERQPDAAPAHGRRGSPRRARGRLLLRRGRSPGVSHRSPGLPRPRRARRRESARRRASAAGTGRAPRRRPGRMSTRRPCRMPSTPWSRRRRASR